MENWTWEAWRVARADVCICTQNMSPSYQRLPGKLAISHRQRLVLSELTVTRQIAWTTGVSESVPGQDTLPAFQCLSWGL